jgi:hypothetical protein
VKRFIAVILTLLSIQLLAAQPAEADAGAREEADSLRVSLLTCSPGNQAYTMYGHTAIRVHNITSGTDIVFNYGMFNYSSDNFLYKFVKGETDYVLGAEPLPYFIQRYQAQGHSIEEQVLNLSQAECQKTYASLMENLQPQNRTYRYSWLYDNCTTRARNMIERCVDGHIQYNIHNPRLTARQILHGFSKADRWIEFGENLILGYELDTALTLRQQMFIPSRYAADADSATIVRADASVQPLVKEKTMLLTVVPATTAGTTDSPLLTLSAIALLTLGVTIVELRRKKTYKWIDTTFQLAEGLAGTLIAFLFFFSQHPGTGSNMMILLLNPLSLLWAPLFAIRKREIATFVILAELMAFAATILFTPQTYDTAVVPLVLILLFRETVNLVLQARKAIFPVRGRNFSSHGEKPLQSEKTISPVRKIIFPSQRTKQTLCGTKTETNKKEK